MSRALCWGLVAIFGVPGVGAQEEKGTVLTLRPAGEPVPALKYRLVAEERSRVPGNAALLYYRAMQMVMQERAQRMVPQTGQDAPNEENPEMRIAEWVSGPLEKVPVEEARTQVEAFRKVLHEVELGAKRRDCDWDFDLREEGVELVMPQIQEMRGLARLVALRVRLAVPEGKTDEAVHWLQVGYSLARHVGESKTLIQTLVGIAIAGQMNQMFEDLIQAPGMPSLYWALAGRPEPFISVGPAVEAEGSVL
ncbi:MAG TPA: hypothetical protein VFT74_10890, partial [Isosphaeraceae bacterium]|nr:hypothetical protein [Isosphaeraceae bacterium]